MYIAGATTSAQFPVTPSAYLTQPQGSLFGSGFVAKIGADLKLVYASYAAYNPTALAVDAAGQAIVGITAEFPNDPSGSLIRLDPTGSRLTYSSNLAAPAALVVDAQGNLYVEGTAPYNFRATPGAFAAPVGEQFCSGLPVYTVPADIFVMKLAAGNFQPIYAAILGEQCVPIAGPLLVDFTGVATVSVFLGHDFPYSAAPSCITAGGAIIAQLSADGSALLFSSRVPTCGVAPIAVSPQDTILAGINVSPHTSVHEFRTTPHPRPPPPR